MWIFHHVNKVLVVNKDVCICRLCTSHGVIMLMYPTMETTKQSSLCVAEAK